MPLDYDDAIEMMRIIGSGGGSAEIFFSNDGYEIINDGDGQNPHASISKETYEKLRDSKMIGQNCLTSFKGRRLYPFIDGDEEEYKKIQKDHEKTTKKISSIVKNI